MKRRDFLKSTIILGLISTGISNTFGFLNKAIASTIVFVTEGKLGYKETAPLNQQKAGKDCKTCEWFKKDAAGGETFGQCTLKAMQNSMKSKEVFVKESGYCNMWKKQSKKT